MSFVGHRHHVFPLTCLLCPPRSCTPRTGPTDCRSADFLDALLPARSIPQQRLRLEEERERAATESDGPGEIDDGDARLAQLDGVVACRADRGGHPPGRARKVPEEGGVIEIAESAQFHE